MVLKSYFSPFSAAAGLGLGSGSLTPPPAAAGGLGLFGSAAAAQRFSTAPGADRTAQLNLAMASAYAAAAVQRNGVGTFGLGANNNLFTNTNNKTRHNSIDRGAATTRSALLEEFR